MSDTVSYGGCAGGHKAEENMDVAGVRKFSIGDWVHIMDDVNFCEGTCCSDADFHVREEDEKWWFVDGNWMRVAQITYCPFCGRMLGHNRVTVPLREEVAYA